MTFTDTTPTPIQSSSGGLRLRVAGVIALALAGLVLLGAGGLLAVHYGARDGRGYYHAPAVAVTSSGYAVSSAGLDIGALNSTETFVAGRVLERVRVSASTTTGKPIFLGLARRGELDAYLSGASRTVVSDVRDDHTAVARDLPGGALRGAPGRQGFWLAKASGSGELTIDWNVKERNWALAVLNADGSPRTAADITFRCRRPVRAAGCIDEVAVPPPPQGAEVSPRRCQLGQSAPTERTEKRHRCPRPITTTTARQVSPPTNSATRSSPPAGRL